MKKAGIYKITNLVNGKVYIGSSVDLQARKSNHFSELRRGIHSNDHLQKAFNKYKEENFIFSLVQEVELIPDKIKLKEIILGYEQHYFSLYDSCNPNKGYNLCKKAGNTLGFKHSEDTKNKLREINLGLKHSEETKKLISSIVKGRTFSEEHKAKIGLASKGRIISDETKKKQRAIKLGKVTSEETKKKQSEANKGDKNGMFGKTHAAHARELMSKANLGKTISEESKEKISQSLKGRVSPRKGTKCTELTKQKISQNSKNKKKVLNITTGQEYGSVIEASKSTNIDKGSIARTCRGLQKLAGTYEWKYIDNND